MTEKSIEMGINEYCQDEECPHHDKALIWIQVRQVGDDWKKPWKWQLMCRSAMMTQDEMRDTPKLHTNGEILGYKPSEDYEQRMKAGP